MNTLIIKSNTDLWHKDWMNFINTKDLSYSSIILHAFGMTRRGTKTRHHTFPILTSILSPGSIFMGFNTKHVSYFATYIIFHAFGMAWNVWGTSTCMTKVNIWRWMGAFGFGWVCQIIFPFMLCNSSQQNTITLFTCMDAQKPSMVLVVKVFPW